MIITNDKNIGNALAFITLSTKLAFDIESTGLNVRKDGIIGFGISNADMGFYIAHMTWEEEELKTLVSKEKCVVVLKALQDRKLITWNGSFDTRFTLEFFNVNLINSLWSDAMLAKHTTDEDMPFRLKDCAKREFGEDSTEEQRLMKESIKANGGTSKQFYKADLSIMGKYCLQDCMLTYRLNEIYLKRLEKQGLTNFYFKDEVMPLYVNVTIPMELNGIPVDVEKLEKAQIDINIDVERIEEEIQTEIKPLLAKFETWFLWKDYAPKKSGLFAQTVAKHYKMNLPLTATGKFSITKSTLETQPESLGRTFLLGGAYLPAETVRELQLKMFKDFNGENSYMFNLSSKHHLKKVFFETLNEEPLTTTDKGSPQCNDDFLEVMAEKYEWVSKLQDYNKLIKLRGTYIEGILDRQEEGIYYPSFFQHRTISGRYGSNIQQLSRPKSKEELPSDVVRKYNNLVRKFFISGDGFSFIDADYESLEPHIFSHVSGDDGLKDIFRKGHDFYSTICIKTEKLNNVSADKKADNYLGSVNKIARQKAKAYSLGVPYGMEEFALGRTLGINKKEAKVLINGYLNGFPQLKEWMDDTFNQVTQKGFVQSQAGRIRHFPKAPKIWYAHKAYILNSLKLWQKFNEHPKKYEQMKYLRKQMKNMLDNGKNFQIQSLGASIINRAAIAIARELRRKGINGYICANIHDQLIVRVPEKDGEKCRKMVQFLMENVYKISIPLKAPACISKDFYEGH